MRRILGGLILSVALVVAAPTTAAADDSIPMEDEWGGSNVNTPGPVTGPTSEILVEGNIQKGTGRRDSVAYAPPDVAVTFDPNVGTGCDLRPDGPATEAELSEPTVGGGVTSGWKTHSYSANVPFAPDRNGTYGVYVCIDGVHQLDTEVLVRLPAPTVTNLVTSAAGREVTLSWDDMRIGAPDVSGYRIERSVEGAEFEALQTVGAEAQTFTDASLPPEGGEATYQVVALRPHVSDAAPSNTSTATFAAGPPTTGGDGTGAPGGTGGGTGSGGTGTVRPGATGATGGGGNGRPIVNPGPTIEIPRVGTPSRNFFPQLLAPPGEDGFTEALPYDQAQGDAIDDELASEPLETLPGRGLAIPIATGLVLAVWALHLRFLARASRPQYEEGIEILLD